MNEDEQANQEPTQGKKRVVARLRNWNGATCLVKGGDIGRSGQNAIPCLLKNVMKAARQVGSSTCSLSCSRIARKAGVVPEVGKDENREE